MRACTSEAAACIPQPIAKRAPRRYSTPSDIPNLPLWWQFQRIGGNLTPTSVSAILREADVGYPQRFVDLFHELRQKDATVHSVLQTRELALVGCEWECEPPDAVPGGKRKKSKAQKIADDCAAMVRDTANFPELISHLVGEGTLFAHAHSELMWARDGRRMYVDRFRNVASRRFIYDIETGDLLFSDLGVISSPAEDTDLCAAYPGKFIEYRPRVNGDVPVREGLARILVWPALFRNWDIRDWMQLAEMAWKPRTVGTYKKGASQEDIDILETALQKFVSTGAVTLPDTVAFVVEWAKSTGTMNTSAHKELFDSMSAEIAKATLGQTLTTEQGQKGSQALGNVHDRVRSDILDADARGVEHAIREYVLRPYVELNYGASAPVPLFRFNTENATDITALSAAIASLRTAGVATIPESWVRDQFGIPEQQGDEQLVGGADPNAPVPDAAPATPNPGPGADGTTPPAAEPAPPTPTP